MSRQLGPVPPIPAETARVARAAFPKGHPFMRMRDEFGAIYEDAAFAHLFPTRGQPAAAPWRLALVTIFQFAENLSDRQAADAVRGRIDWKYALSLELTDPGFDASVLSEFRTRLVEGGEEELLLRLLLARFRCACSWRVSASGDCSRPAVASGPTRPTSSAPSARSTVSNW